MESFQAEYLKLLKKEKDLEKRKKELKDLREAIALKSKINIIPNEF